MGAGAVRRPRSFGRGTLREKRLCCGPADGGHHNPPRTTRRRDPRRPRALPVPLLLRSFFVTHLYLRLNPKDLGGVRSFKGAGPLPSLLRSFFKTS